MNASRCYVIAGSLALSLALAARAQLTNFTIIGYPTRANGFGINDAGDMVGAYYERDDPAHTDHRRGFLLRGGKFVPIDFPGMPWTIACDINNAGDIVGFYLDANGVNHGFLLSGGRFTTVDFPGAEMTRVQGINAKGEIVGFHWYPSRGTIMNTASGFLLSGGRFTSIQYPESMVMHTSEVFDLKPTSVAPGNSVESRSCRVYRNC